MILWDRVSPPHHGPIPFEEQYPERKIGLMPQEKFQEKLFNRLLADLEQSPDEIPGSMFASIKMPLPPFKRAALGIHCSTADIIRVMKSGIFHRGGLKGRSLSGKKSYKVYFF